MDAECDERGGGLEPGRVLGTSYYTHYTNYIHNIHLTKGSYGYVRKTSSVTACHLSHGPGHTEVSALALHTDYTGPLGTIGAY